jgi:hypothetical protein
MREDVMREDVMREDVMREDVMREDVSKAHHAAIFTFHVARYRRR